MSVGLLQRTAAEDGRAGIFMAEATGIFAEAARNVIRAATHDKRLHTVHELGEAVVLITTLKWFEPLHTVM